MKVSDVLAATASLNKKHFATLIGERQSGSTWGESLTAEKISNLPWQQLPQEEYVAGVHLSFCSYFRLSDEAMAQYFPHARQRMELLGDVAVGSVNVVEGAHGLELVSTLVQPRACTTAWLIVGPAEDEAGREIEGQMVWTLYPGEITARLPKVLTIDTDPGTLDRTLPYAVKGV